LRIGCGDKLVIDGVGIDGRSLAASLPLDSEHPKWGSVRRWAFQHIYKRAPTPDELAEYERHCTLSGLHGFPDHWLTDADRADLAASDPGEAKRIFARLANPSGAAYQPEASAPLVPAAESDTTPAEVGADSESDSEAETRTGADSTAKRRRRKRRESTARRRQTHLSRGCWNGHGRRCASISRPA
jgi:hypothetical protein